MSTRILTVAARYNGLVQPPGARMILIRFQGTTSCSGRPRRSTTYDLTNKWTPALRAALASAIARCALDTLHGHAGQLKQERRAVTPVSYTHLRAHETG